MCGFFCLCRLDHILLETTGLANPAPLASILWLDDQLESSVKLDSIITVSFIYLMFCFVFFWFMSMKWDRFIFITCTTSHTRNILLALQVHGLTISLD